MDLSDDQVEDLRSLRRICQPLAGEIVIIGAMALQAHVRGSRHTYDIDVAVAVDMEDFASLSVKLRQVGWSRDKRREQRWLSPHRSRFDLLPAGPELRKKGEINWEESELTMNLAGFDHVFLHSKPLRIAPGLMVNVVLAPVLILLKMAAYLDRPHERRRDLDDIAEILERYEVDEDRIYSDEVYDAGELDFDAIRAFLLGRDLRSIALPRDERIVDSFLRRVLRDQEELDSYARDEDAGAQKEFRLQSHLQAFHLGFRM